MTFNPLTALRALRDNQDLSSGEFAVMVAIVLRADSGGCMWASQQLLSKDCKLSPRSVREKLSKLMEKGLISRVKRPGTSDYCVINARALTPAISAGPPVLTLAESAAPPGEICLSPRQDLPHPPAESAAYLHKELPNDLPIDLPNKDSEIRKPDPDAQILGDLWEAVNQLYLSSSIGHRALKLTKKRREALKARNKEHGSEKIYEVVGWWLESSHPRARFLREGGYGIDTVLQRSKFDQYATMSELPEGSITDQSDPLSILGAARKLRLEEGT